jgi:hypothetical protein
VTSPAPPVLLSGLPYWARTGQSDMLADYRRRFGEWLTQR